MNKSKKRLLFLTNRIVSCSLFLVIALAGCSNDNSPRKFLPSIPDNEPTGTASLQLHPDQILKTYHNSSLLNMLQSSAPSDEDLTISSYDILFKHNEYPYQPVEIKDLAGTTTATDPVQLQAGPWTIYVHAKNSKSHEIGLGISTIVINPGRLSTAEVSIRNIEGNAAVNLSIDLSSKTLTSPKIAGKLVAMKPDGTTGTSINLTFTINASKTLASFQGDIKAGLYEIELELQDLISGTYLPLANFHDTIALYAGIPMEEEYSLSDIAGGIGIGRIKDDIDRPIKITLSGFINELTYPDVMKVSAYPNSSIDRYEWRLNNVLIKGENSNTITLKSWELIPREHELEVVMWKGSNISSKKSLFIVKPYIAPTTDAVMLSCGEYFSLIIRLDGTIWTWGNNNSGQLGDGTTTNRNAPAQVNNLSDIIQISGGGAHSLALISDGTVWSWGDNYYGQLGDGTTTNRSTPVQVNYLNNIIQITGGITHSLALKSDGTVWAWGNNNSGQLGDGTTYSRITPVQINSLSNIIQIAGGGVHSLALRSDGTVWAWGYNYYGQLGDETTYSRSRPVQVNNLSNIIQIAGGGAHSLALRSDGTVWAWGYNGFGQLGIGTTYVSYTPVQIYNLSNVIQIAGGNSHSLALRSDGTVWTWGNNIYGQLGNGTTTNRNTPAQVNSLTNIIQIDGGGDHSLALRLDHTIWAWGGNDSGQLGNGTTTNRTTPVSVTIGQ